MDVLIPGNFFAPDLLILCAWAKNVLNEMEKGIEELTALPIGANFEDISE